MPADLENSSGEVTARSGRSRSYGDCTSCAETKTVPDTPAAVRRWAAQHAASNPGHAAHVTTERVRIYESRGAR